MNAKIDISNVTLRTKRLILRNWKLSDADDLFEYASVDGVGQMAGWSPHEDKEESLNIIKMFIEGRNVFALEYNGKVIGSIGLHNYNETELPEFSDKKGCEIGYVLSKNYWGMGLMPEAVSEIIRYLFEEIGLDFLVCGHFINNLQSQRVQEKCGFKHYKLTKVKLQNGEVKDLWISVLMKN